MGFGHDRRYVFIVLFVYHRTEVDNSISAEAPIFRRATEVPALHRQVVAEAENEIKPLKFPAKPFFSRKSPSIRSFILCDDAHQNDDEIYINTQSGTQWDGLKHHGVAKHAVFYNNTVASALHKGELDIADTGNVDKASIRLGIHNVLLDMVKYYTANGSKPLPYDPWTTHGVPVADLQACAKQQGVTFKQGDILILRVGFMARHNAASVVERNAVVGKPKAFAGILQEEDMKRFLWNNHFAALVSDQPAIEVSIAN
ncbi:hypothetical protein EUX98_g8424 [Antrodiella citrinella]|uniref:Uncharacterized protein n=1 Tax=Antrodiella citrinella TaxID=2447956 RepID=A0A4S4MDU2_9APHY|nr:hypothetical protein EUX98_g8424 [Antrodiella citrinella]